MYHLPACRGASDVIVIIKLEERAGNSAPGWGGSREVGGARFLAAHPGLPHQGKKSSVRRFVILTWDLLGEEKSPSNPLTGRGFASDQGRTLKLQFINKNSNQMPDQLPCVHSWRWKLRFTGQEEFQISLLKLPGCVGGLGETG